jgi:sec-independent protein translocase protein TatA
MEVVLLFFEFIGTPELLVIMVAALVLFGPRKLPELGRSIGKSLGEFKRASEEFKRTWETEVDLEKIERESRIERLTQEAHNTTVARADNSLEDMSNYNDHQSHDEFVLPDYNEENPSQGTELSSVSNNNVNEESENKRD